MSGQVSIIPATFLGVAQIFDVAPDGVMLAAAYLDHLDAACVRGENCNIEGSINSARLRSTMCRRSNEYTACKKISSILRYGPGAEE